MLSGGSGKGGIVFKIDTSGHFTVLYNFSTASGGYSPYGGLLIDSTGNLYGTAAFGGTSSNGVVYKITP